MSEQPTSNQRCTQCGMECNTDEYHPYAACLMFIACHNSETVRANLEAVREQGRREVRDEVYGYE